MEEPVKQFTIKREGKVIYSGNNALRAVQVYCCGEADIEFSGLITEAVFDQIIALQERLN